MLEVVSPLNITTTPWQKEGRKEQQGENDKE